MPTFTKDNTPRTPFGKNEWRRSTKDTQYESYMCYAGSVPNETIDGDVTKVLQSGTIMAKITSGPGAGLYGPYQAVGTDEVQTVTGSGTISGGTWLITSIGGSGPTAAIPYNANAAAVQAAVDAVADPALGVVVTGGPLPGGGVFTFTYNGPNGVNVAQITVDGALLTGAAAAITPNTTVAGAPGATDGRQTAANIVGINDTFLPWTLTVRDVEISVAYAFTAVQAWCFELNTAGQRIALTNTTRDAMLALPNIRGLFK